MSEGHPSREKRAVHPIDDRLRQEGFRIHSRPRKGETLWSLAGKVYTEAQALAWCEEE